jgi:hypothetical protein
MVPWIVLLIVSFHVANAQTSSPTPAPTDTPFPTNVPTDAPTNQPTAAPTAAPTNAPTASPSNAPTAAPTNAPTNAPTHAPTKAPTNAPTAQPTNAPTLTPTESPTIAPTFAPTKEATVSFQKVTNVDIFILAGAGGSLAIVITLTVYFIRKKRRSATAQRFEEILLTNEDKSTGFGPIPPPSRATAQKKLSPSPQLSSQSSAPQAGSLIHEVSKSKQHTTTDEQEVSQTDRRPTEPDASQWSTRVTGRVTMTDGEDASKKAFMSSMKL